MVTPLGDGVEENWRRLLACESGAGPITRFDASQMAARIACEVPRGDGANGTFNADAYVAPKDQRRMDDFIIYGIAAAKQAIQDSGWKSANEEDSCRAGVLIGSGIGGLPGIEQASLELAERGPRRVSPFFITGRLINLVAGNVSIEFGLKGPNHAVVTACASGSHAIGDAARLIMDDDADMMVAGGAEATICPIGIAGFAACKALSTSFNDAPARASRPYDKDRDGFVMGEGSGVLVLEEMEYAKRRGARIYAEVIGYGLSGDAYHLTAPEESGDGGFRAMNMALKKAGVSPSDIHYVNAHGTSTPLGDEIELGAVTRLFGNAAADLVMSSTKSSTGHLLGAAGAVEAIYSILAIRDGVAPATLNLENPSVETVINLAAGEPVKRKIETVISNSFGFGGTNASLVMSRARL